MPWLAVNGMLDMLGKGSTGSIISGVVQWLPLDTIASLPLIALYDARDRAKAVLYEVSGLSGHPARPGGPPREVSAHSPKSSRSNASAAARKAAYEASTDVARDALRIKAEILCEHFSEDTIRGMSGFDQMSEVVRLKETLQQQAQQAMRKPRSRRFSRGSRLHRLHMPPEEAINGLVRQRPQNPPG